MRLELIVAIQALTAISALSLNRAPTVILDHGIFTGVQTGKVAQFLGIPFGKSTEGQSRLQLPEAVDAYHGYHNVTVFGCSCPQQALHLPPLDLLPQAAIDILNAAFSAQISPSSTSEDCLTIDVVKPVFIERGAKLPVLVYIYGGGFQVGGSVTRNGSKTVSRSLELEEPVIFVAINYRVSGFGFLASKEVRDAGVANLGLHDQRLALKWIQKYIHAFGGDPTKVTLWGQSAGAIPIACQMLINDGDTDGLFRAGFMQSGSPMPVGGLENGQKYYDDVVERTGCAGTEDTLACLRTVEYDAFQAAIDASPTLFDYESLDLAWMPRTDGVLFADHPQRLVQQGKVANIPIITGDCDDEGTMFSLAQTNLSTDAQFKEWIQTFLLPAASEEDIDRLMNVYPSNPAEGSPFNTGSGNAITPQFKRFSSLLGDAVFQGPPRPRRFFSHSLSGRQDIYTYLYTGGKAIPALGSTHGLDIDIMDDYVIRFAATLDPNIGSEIVWPKWTSDGLDMLVIGAEGISNTQDTYREKAMEVLSDVLFRNPM